MRRIIQKYQEGGVVQSAPGPAVATGIPQGGHAAAAIQSYLSGQAAGPLSYSSTTGGDANQTRLDYHAAAKILRDKRIADAAAAAAAAATAAVVNSDGGSNNNTASVSSNNNNSTGSDGSTFSWQTDQDTYGATGGFWGGDETSETNLINNESISDDDFWDTYESGNSSGGLISGGGSDGQGNWGVIGDIGGAIGDAFGITNYSGNNDNNSSSTTTTTSNSGGGWEDSAWNPKNWNNGGNVTSDIQRYNNGSTGGVSIAKSGNEEEIRQRQLMSSPLPKAQASPLSEIGSQLAMGAIDKGIGSAASSMAAKEGIMGTLGNALGGNAATGAVTGAAGTGLMAALGPIGIGIGLGKLFGLFNDGGKVPCSCGKTSCKCAKEMKSPLSGE